jgi:puromycin-sensitive aminopeptidase
MNTSPLTMNKLPRNVYPTEYDVRLFPDLLNGVFSGLLDVVIEVVEATSVITLHAYELQIFNVLVTQDGETYQDGIVSYDKEKQRVSFTFAKPLVAGTNAILSLDYTGRINDQMVGLYRSEYVTADGQKKLMASTQFEAIHARWMLPCWDEPEHKAIFHVSLIVQEHFSVLGNMQIIEEAPVCGTNKKYVEFAPTPKMSSYLLAIAFGEFECIETTTKEGVAFRVWNTAGRKDLGVLGLQFGAEALSYLTHYFGVPYPLLKMDMLAVEKFAFGAMENWGLVTYRRTALEIDPKNSSLSLRQQVFNTIAHELAHQWFGNLVTMEDWEGLWLNESFATWMAKKVVGHFYPEWQSDEQFVAADVARGMRLDGLNTTHAIHQPIEDESQIDGAFDEISYQKGGAVIEMLEKFVSEDVFRAGLHLYMKRHAYGNTKSEDLWKAIAECAGDNGSQIVAMMESWIKQAGHPVVRGEVSVQEDGQVALNLSQKRFTFLDNGKNETTLWPVPMRILYTLENGSMAHTLHLLTKEKEVLILPYANPDMVVDINSDFSGFYHANYDPMGWSRLIDEIRESDTPLNPRERFGVQYDAFALSLAGKIDASLVLKILSSYADENHFIVWSGVASTLREMNRLIPTDAKLYQDFLKFAKTLFRQIVETVGWDVRAGEAPTIPLLRSIVLEEGGRYGIPSVITEAERRFALVKNGDLGDPNVRSVVYKVSAMYGGLEAYTALLDLYTKQNSPEERVRIMMALGWVDVDCLKKALAFSMSDQVSVQDKVRIVSAVGAHPLGARLAWEFVRDNWMVLRNLFKGSTGMLSRFVEAVEFLKDQVNEEEVRAFFADTKNIVPGIEKSVQQTLERIAIHRRWSERAAATLPEWFASEERRTWEKVAAEWHSIH